MERVPSVMSDTLEQLFARASVNGCGPADEVRPWSKKCKYLAVAVRSGLQASFHAPAAGTARLQRCRGCSYPVCEGPILLREFLAGWPSLGTAAENSVRTGSLNCRRFSDVDGPHCTTDRVNILWIVDFLMTKELGPSTVGSITEVVCQLALCIPTTGGLEGIFSQKGKARIGVAKCDHVTREDTRARASSRTRHGASSSGDHLSPSA